MSNLSSNALLSLTDPLSFLISLCIYLYLGSKVTHLTFSLISVSQSNKLYTTSAILKLWNFFTLLSAHVLIPPILSASTTVVCYKGISVSSHSPCRHGNTPVADGSCPGSHVGPGLCTPSELD